MKSIWRDGAALPEFEPLNGDVKTDVLIIGGGLAGLLCAYKLKEAGVDYLLIEAEKVCSGVTGNTTAKITAQHGLLYHKLVKRFGVERARMYLDANLAAVEEFRHLAGEIDCDFMSADAYVYSLDRPEKLEKELTALEKLGYGAEYVQELELPMPTVGAVRFPDQACFDPLKFCAGILPGLNIRERTRVIAFDEQGVVTDHGRIRAEKIITATHFPIFNKHGSYFLKLYQHRSYVLALDNAPKLKGMYVDEREKGLSFRPAGERLLLGGGDHRTGKRGGNWAELKEFAGTYYPHAVIRGQWAAQDCMSLDGAPYIGQYSRQTPNLYVATGFNKWGITSSMTAAGILCDLVCGKENPYAPVFSPSRTMLRPQLFLNGLEAAGNLLRPTVPRCPHMGCALKWNPYERSWDCSCHGSRFSRDGEVLDGPANGDLKR